MVAGSKSFIARVHRFRKMFGGGMRQAGILASAGIYAIDHHFDRLKEDHEHAKRLALGLKDIRGISIIPEHVETNIIIFEVTATGKTAVQLKDDMKKEGVLIHAMSPTQVRLLTHLDVTREDIDTALRAFKKVLQ
jgi:threonine aldolase